MFIHDHRSRTETAALQRARIIAAAVHVVEAEGFRGLTIAKVIRRARVSHTAFYSEFGDREACFLAAFEQVLDAGREIARDAYRGEADWRKGVRAALLSLLAQMERQHGLARLCVVEALAAGPLVLDRRARALREIAQELDRVCAGACSHGAVQPPLVEAIVGGIASLLHTRLLDQGPAPLTDLLGLLMGMIAMAYVGPAAACEELDVPAAQVVGDKRRVSPRQGLDLLAELDMRLTYRTIRVLAAIAGNPGASNLQIARDAGIGDQGQMSKLLARLARLGLIDNGNPRRIARGTNAWRLTAHGEQVQRATQRDW